LARRRTFNRTLLQIPNSYEADQIIRWLAGPDGAVGIADDAAWELICMACDCYEDGGHLWYETHPLYLMLGIENEDTSNAVSRAVRYLAARGLLVANRKQTSLVRYIDAGETP
jgi:hypothetical protein